MLRKFLAVAALLIFALVLIAWPLNYFRTDNLAWDGRSAGYQLTSDRGEIDFFWMPGAAGFYRAGHTTFHWPPDYGRGPRVGKEFLGFRYHHQPAIDRKGVPYEIYIWGIPYWFFFLLAAAPALSPAMRLIRRRTLVRRLAAGRCPSCGYDLRGTPQQCPECGWMAG